MSNTTNTINNNNNTINTINTINNINNINITSDEDITTVDSKLPSSPENVDGHNNNITDIYSIGDVIWLRVAGCPYWPCKVCSFHH